MPELDQVLTSAISDWLNSAAKERSLEQGALLLLRLNANRIMYNQILQRKMTEKLEYELRKHLNIRLHGLTRAEVEKVEKEVLPRIRKELKNEAAFIGRRADHDQLPENIRAIYDRNGERYRKMHNIFETLKTMRDATPCDRHELVHQLAQLDKEYREAWDTYDHWQPGDEQPEETTRTSEFDIRAVIAARKAVSHGRKRLKTETDDRKRADIIATIRTAVKTLRSARQTFADGTIDALKELGVWDEQNEAQG